MQTSNYLQNKLIDWEFRGQAFTPPATIYVGLLLCSKGVLARSTAYSLNDTVSFVAADGKNHLYKVTTAGTTAASAPAYAGTAGEAITDGTAVLTEQTPALAAGTAQVEPTGNGYARASIACSLANFAGTQGAGTTTASTGTSATTSNNIVLNFGTPTGDWAPTPEKVWGICTYDAASAGNPLRFAGLPADVSIGLNNSVSFAAAQLVFKNDQ